MENFKNIIVIFNDDHGQWALPAYGNKDLNTPNLDYLAQKGVLMENAFTPTPVCSPARACFFTGRLASQHGLHDYIVSDKIHGNRDWLKNEVTLAQLLKASGFQVALSGKWHLGNDIECQPGFDYWFALSGDYPTGHKGRYRYSMNGKIIELSGYKTHMITDRAVNFLHNRDQEKPFFLFVGYTATHSPWSDHPERLVEHYRHKKLLPLHETPHYPFGKQNLESLNSSRLDPQEGLAHYYAAVSCLDESVGRLMDELETLELTDSTLVIYTSDHGLCCGQHGIWGKGNGTMPLNMVEESIRIPLICYNPKKLFTGIRRIEFVDHLDLFQTLLDYADIKRNLENEKTYPGRSFLPIITNEILNKPWKNVQYCEYGNVRMARDFRYKLILHEPKGKNLFFDLMEDPNELCNLISENMHLDRINFMKRNLDSFFRQYEAEEKSGMRINDPEPSNYSSPWAKGKMIWNGHEWINN